MAGAACAAGLAAGGVPVRVVERGRAVGGRMASPTLSARRVDIGAGYFTVRDPGFAGVVERWQSAGLAREWTDTFAILQPGAPARTTTGPMRWAAPGGLRSLVRDLLAATDVELGTEVPTLPPGDVVLAMPDPQAARLTDVPGAVECQPVLTVVAGFAECGWSLPGAAFVHDHPDLEFVADDGDRRGDGAAVLVAHSTPALAGQHLAAPDAAIGPLVGAVRELLGIGAPAWTHAHRWTFAKPTTAHDCAFDLRQVDGRLVGFAGDQWCPQGSARVESAWRSGTDLAAAIVAARR